MSAENLKTIKYRYIICLTFSFFLLVSFLIFVLFQKVLVKKFGFPKLLLYVDEAFVVTFFFILILYFIVANKVDRLVFPFLKVFFIFTGIGILSGLINGNSKLVTLLGIFDYLKNFLFIFIGYYFLNNRKLLVKLYNVLLVASLILIGIALFQEFQFLLGKTTGSIRFGLLRTPSLVGHPNVFGLYVFLIFTIRLFLRSRLDIINLLLLVGIFLSLSRFVWVSTLVVIMGFSILQRKKKIMIVSFLILIGFVIFSFSYFATHTIQELTLEGYFRGYALAKSFEVWNDHKLLGVGPGMWGGVISVIFHSPVYERYGFDIKWYELYVERIHSLDQFYPQLLAETGILGFLSFIQILYFLFMIPYKISKQTVDPVLRGLLKGLSFVLIGLVCYLFGSGLNLVHFLAPYLILLGSALGVYKYESITRKQIPFPKRRGCY